jgi:hypothetical protein
MPNSKTPNARAVQKRYNWSWWPTVACVLIFILSSVVGWLTHATDEPPAALRHEIYSSAISKLGETDIFAQAHIDADLAKGEIRSNHHILIKEQLENITTIYMDIKQEEESLVPILRDLLTNLELLSVNDSNGTARTQLQQGIRYLNAAAERNYPRWVELGTTAQSAIYSISTFRRFILRQGGDWRYAVVGISAWAQARLQVIKQVAQKSEMAYDIADGLRVSARAEADAWWFVHRRANRIASKRAFVEDYGSNEVAPLDPSLRTMAERTAKDTLRVLGAE